MAGIQRMNVNRAVVVGWKHTYERPRRNRGYETFMASGDPWRRRFHSRPANPRSGATWEARPDDEARRGRLRVPFRAARTLESIPRSGWLVRAAPIDEAKDRSRRKLFSQGHDREHVIHLRSFCPVRYSVLRIMRSAGHISSGRPSHPIGRMPSTQTSSLCRC